MKKIEREPSKNKKGKLARGCGYTGLPAMVRFYWLYGYDCLLDALIDCMHNIPMNVALRYLEWLVENGIIDAVEVDRLLSKFPWTKGWLLSHY